MSLYVFDYLSDFLIEMVVVTDPTATKAVICPTTAVRFNACLDVTAILAFTSVVRIATD